MSEARINKNLSLDPDVIRMGEQLVEVDHRANFSNLVAALIAQKHEQLVKEGKIQPAKEAQTA